MLSQNQIIDELNEDTLSIESLLFSLHIILEYVYISNSKFP